MPPRPNKSDPSDIEGSIPYMLGQIQGQLRELIHSSNSNGQALVALSTRVAALEASNDRREGAAGIVSMILKSPLVGWFVGLIVSGWAVLSGKVHI